MKNISKSKADLTRNNLDKSSSPYLLQHISNPVCWQEWSEDLIKHALAVNKPLLVSVGYATCHWCHVMASEAFSDINTAAYLNDNFICIKVDREQRPDIDQFMMDFINKQNGRGGWPLNVFLTPSLNPVFALTYAPAFSRNSMHSFISIAEKVFTFMQEESMPQVADEKTIIDTLSGYYDNINGGFGSGQKFPSHSTLLYLLYNLAVDDSPTLRSICTKTLNAIRLRGLHDHLQGGIFRYCVDSEWTIPHFEKMLYDQAMALWNYSLAYRVIGKEEYRIMAKKILRCLDESFESEGFYISAHDADTEHEEGATYLWSIDQIENVLDPDEFALFSGSYYITMEGNFDGRNHLIRLNDITLKGIEDKLLAVRKKRKQPSRDDKILSGINALLAIAMIQAGRLMDEPDLEEKAASLVKRILYLFWDGKTLGHSCWNEILQKQGFLTDAASLLTAIGMLFENDKSWDKSMQEMAAYVESFNRGGKWIESDAPDFQPVYATWFDHPAPAGISMAEFGLSRVALLTGKELHLKEYLQPFQTDFYNITAMISNGLFHVITSPDPIPWNLIPVNTVMVRGNMLQDCYRGACTVPSPGTFPDA
jgi:uncharacterized protein YyaL (SSP411 family)